MPILFPIFSWNFNGIAWLSEIRPFRRWNFWKQVEINKVLHESGVKDRYLVARFENATAVGSRFERVGRTKFLRKWSISFAKSQKFCHMCLRPQCTFGTKKSKKSTAGTHSKMVLFQKAWWKRVKEYSFNLSTGRGIVKDCVAVILPPQLTL